MPVLQRTQLHVSQLQLQRLVRDLEKRVRRVGERHLQVSVGRGRRGLAAAGQQLLHCAGAILRRIDERDGVSEQAVNCRPEQRIMRSAEHKRVDAIGDHRLEVLE